VVWLGEDLAVWPAILLASLWKGYPYMCLMLLAGLQTIPQDVYEAADVDGATGLRRLWYVTLPLLKPVASIVTLVALVLTWNNFQMIWVLTEGGPAYATSVLATYVYTKGFVFFQLGSGAAVATLSILVILIVCVIYARMTRLEEREP
jgi:multiple sugar transport system permease protein